MSAKHAIVIGAGAGGLASSIDLARAGFRVTLLERGDTPGGKMHTLVSSGATLPACRTYRLHTYQDRQTELSIPLYQGECVQVDENEYLGTLELTGIPEDTAGKQAIRVTFWASSDSELDVTATVRNQEIEARIVKGAAKEPEDPPKVRPAEARPAKQGLFSWLRRMFRSSAR